MKLTSATIKNYKSFVDTGAIPLGASFTVLVGQNNSGKTAFLEAINPNIFRDAPHVVPNREIYPSVPDPSSQIEYDLKLMDGEFRYHFLAAGSQLLIPVRSGTDDADRESLIARLFTRSFSLELVRRQGRWESRQYPSHKLFAPFVDDYWAARVGPRPDRKGWLIYESGSNRGDNLPDFVGGFFGSSYYGFRAERLSLAQCQITETSLLTSNATNLASVLLQLPKNHTVHERYQKYIREIFPSIYRVSSRPISPSTAEIEVTMNDSDARSLGGGITVSLTESGSGVGQVLALLYVVVTADFPRIIAIDEPNSFLHPGAAKKLISILKQFDHQYIISTHSPELIKIADPEYVHLIEWQGTESIVKTLDQKSLRDQRRLLSDLGVNLSDLFGADHVLWVEGPTEERCFPLLLDHLGLASPTLSIASLVATDDLSGNKPRAMLAWEIYEKLSLGSALVAPALAFVLDRENRTEKEMADLDRASKSKVNFLPRRTYENYLINAEAVAAIVGKLIGSPAQNAAEWLENHKMDRKYLGHSYQDVGRWEALVDAPKLLHDLFNAISDAKVEFRKTTHSIMLTEWLLENQPGQLSELLQFVRSVVRDH